MTLLALLLIFLLIPLLILFFVIPSAFWIWMIIDAANRKFKGANDKVIWILIIIFTHILGAAVYFFAVKQQTKKPVKGTSIAAALLFYFSLILSPLGLIGLYLMWKNTKWLPVVKWIITVVYLFYFLLSVSWFFVQLTNPQALKPHVSTSVQTTTSTY